MSILDAIIATKKQEIISLPDIMPVKASGSSFIEAILGKQPALIAEVKPKAPSSNQLLRTEDIPRFVRIFERHAQAISVLCDRHYFGGGFDLLAQVRSLTNKPLLAKEFIISTKQIDHAAQNGADAILLIVAILEPPALAKLLTHAVALNLDILIEVHSRAEADKAACTFNLLSEEEKNRVLFGINNRNLRTLQTDLRTTEKLAPLINKRLPGVRGIITESGIHSREDIQLLQPLVQGFLIGTSILRANKPDVYLTSLFSS
ncbi:MAG: indole-3-glycerol phosphate synthase TrpC [Candidatus Peribacter sp.]|jgi:indole-3-glycerol phosphate synthase/phosphoribosylanthranilate isomerase